MGASETKGGCAAALEEQTKDAKRSTSQSSDQIVLGRVDVHGVTRGSPPPVQGRRLRVQIERGSKASGKHGSKAHAKTASEEINFPFKICCTTTSRMASAGAVRPEGVVPENWAEDEIIVDQRVSRGAHFAAGAVIVGVLCAYARARRFANAGSPRGGGRRREAALSPSERRFATLEGFLYPRSSPPVSRVARPFVSYVGFVARASS